MESKSAIITLKAAKMEHLVLGRREIGLAVVRLVDGGLETLAAIDTFAKVVGSVVPCACYLIGIARSLAGIDAHSGFNRLVLCRLTSGRR